MTTTTYALVNGTDRVVFSDARNHPCAEDFDGPVMAVSTADGERLMVVEQARAEYARLLRSGYRKAA